MDIQDLDDNWCTPRDLGNLHVTYPIHPRMTFHAGRIITKCCACHPRDFSQSPTPASQFAHCHDLTQPWQCDSQKTRNTTRLKSKVLRLPRKMNTDMSKVLRLPRKMKVAFWKPRKSIAPVKNDFRRFIITKCYACHTKRRYATFQTFNSDKFCNNCYRHGHSVLIANPCEGLWTLADGCERTSRANTSLPRTPQSITRTLRYPFRQKCFCWSFHLGSLFCFHPTKLDIV